MAKEELIEMNGVVAEVLPDSRFRVTLEVVSKRLRKGEKYFGIFESRR